MALHKVIEASALALLLAQCLPEGSMLGQKSWMQSFSKQLKDRQKKISLASEFPSGLSLDALQFHTRILTANW